MTDKDLIKLANILKGENIDNLLITDATTLYYVSNYYLSI